MTNASVYADAGKALYGGLPVAVDADAWEKAQLFVATAFKLLEGRYSVTSFLDAVADMRLMSSSTHQARRAGPTKEDVISEFISSELGQSSLEHCISSARQAFGLDKSFFEEHMHKYNMYSKLAGKDELRPAEKNGATRAFIVPPLGLHLLEHVLFSDMGKGLRTLSCNKANMPENSSLINVGIPVQHASYDRIVQYMNRFQNQSSYDVKANDGGIRNFEFKAIKRLRYWWLKPQWRTHEVSAAIDYVYYLATRGWTIFPDGKVYRKVASQPSGRFLTLEDNSLITALRHAYAYVRLRPESTYKDWRRDVFLNIVGDDAHVSHNFTDEELLRYDNNLRDFGIVITSEPSNTFCKHEFTRVDSVWVPVYPAKHSFEAMNWVEHSREYPDIVSAYATACGHYNMAMDSSPCFSMRGKPVNVREMLSAYLDFLEAYPMNGSVFSESALFAKYHLSTTRLGSEEIDELYLLRED